MEKIQEIQDLQIRYQILDKCDLSVSFPNLVAWQGPCGEAKGGPR